MFELGLCMIIFGTSIAGYRMGSKYGINIYNKTRNKKEEVKIEKDDIIEEEQSSIRQHFNILKLISKRKNEEDD